MHGHGRIQTPMNQTTDATAIFAPLWKRKWLILLVALLVAGGTYEYYKGKPTVYSVTTQLYLGAGSEEQGLVSGSTKALSVNAANQTALINSLITQTVRARLRKEHNATALSGKVRAKGAEKSQFITISAEARTPKAVALLANLTAQAYIRRQRATFLRGIERSVAIARRQLRRVEAAQKAPAPTTKGKGSAKSSGTVSSSSVLQAAALSSKVNQLESELSIKGVQQLAPAKGNSALLLSPHPKQNAIFGFALGLVLAAVAAYALSRFDRRLRTLADIEGTLQTQILTALPPVRHPVSHKAGEAGPSRSLVEPLRRLHTTLQLESSSGADGPRHPRSILFVSGDAADGKSTLIANLARVQRDAGERVAVVDADFRRPAQARLLDLAEPHGLAEVLEGTLVLDEAMQTVEPLHREPSTNSTGSASGLATVVETRGMGTLSVLASGGEVANPPALLARQTMTDLLASVAAEFDYVLIDAPSPLEVSDVMPLLNMVDGIVIVARIGHTRQISAERLTQLLLRAGAPVLGSVANSVPRADIEKYGFSSASNRRRGRGKLIGR